MPKQAGIGDNFYFNGYDLSGDIASIDTITTPRALIDATVLNAKAFARLNGLRDGAISFTTLMDTNTPVIATPSVPASNTPVVSTFPYIVYVTITGGTMTNVTVNGVTVGTGAGTYVLPALGTIQMTYSVAPTWNWVALGTEHNALTAGLNSSVDGIATYFRGTALANPAVGQVVRQTSYNPTRDDSGSLMFKVDMVADGFGTEWGIMLTPGLRTDVTATVGAAFDQTPPSGATAFGCQAYLQLIDLVGTNVDVTITHCATSGGSYTSLIDFGSLTTFPQAVRVATSNVTTVNEFLKVNTTGTFSYAVFAVLFCRNPVAGYS